MRAVLCFVLLTTVQCGRLWGPPPLRWLPLRGGAAPVAVKVSGTAAGGRPMSWWRRDTLVQRSPMGDASSRRRPVSTGSRLEKEVAAFMAARPCNCSLIIGESIRDWTVEFAGAQGSAYEGETFRLKMVFPREYPSKPPRVFFLKPTPQHQHVYSNGDICLNLLGSDWRPNLTAETLVVSIISMLSSAKAKKIPVDNALHAGSQPGAGDQLNWMYHDDNC